VEPVASTRASYRVTPEADVTVRASTSTAVTGSASRSSRAGCAKKPSDTSDRSSAVLPENHEDSPTRSYAGISSSARTSTSHVSVRPRSTASSTSR
jgi:hypothetical protein